MKMNKWLAALLAAWFLIPFFSAKAETAPAFTVDEDAVLREMDRSWRQGYMPAVGGNRWTMILPVRSAEAAGPVTAELVFPTERYSFFRPGKMTMTAQQETTGIWRVRFSLDLFPNQKNADYPCVIRLTGKNKEGKELVTEIPYTIRMRGATESIEKARIEITDVRADLNTGEEGEVKVTVTNLCSATVIENLELKISDSAGHILPRDAETLKIGTLGIGESMTVSYPVTVTEKAVVAPHVLKLDLAWTALGQAANYSANYTVAVRQEIRMEQGGLKMAPAVTAGDSVSLSLPIMNMGKADIVNVLATVTLPGITERQSVLVGTIQPGETKQAQMVLSPAKDITGDFAGEMTVECTDQDGNPASFRVPVNLKVEAPVKVDAGKTASGESVKKEIPAAVTWGLAGGCGLLLVLIMTQSLVLRRKIHRLEEEKL